MQKSHLLNHVIHKLKMDIAILASYQAWVRGYPIQLYREPTCIECLIATLQEGYESSSAIYVTGNPRLLQCCYTIGSDLAMNLACGRVCAVCL